MKKQVQIDYLNYRILQLEELIEPLKKWERELLECRRRLEKEIEK